MSYEKLIWKRLDAIASYSTCEKRHVGCIIYNTKTMEVAIGVNYHKDGVCDCNTTHIDENCVHAEISAINSLMLPQAKEDLIAFINHAPCKNCAAALKDVVNEIRIRQTSKLKAH